MDFPPDQLRLLKIFQPRALSKFLACEENDIRFVHYTSADAAVKILQTKEVWMRKTSCMEDYMEVQHGLDCLHVAYNGDGEGAKFKAALENISSGLNEEIQDLFNGWAPHIHADTYVTCFSEHDPKEDTFGRLSMWRSRGKGMGIAIVMKNTPFLGISDALKAYTSPVAYLNPEEFGVELGNIAANIENNLEFLRSRDREEIKGLIFHAFRFAAVCTKHPGLEEEREWRVVYTPKIDQSERLVKSIEVIDGTPQPIYKIPLENVPEEGFVGATIPELIERIIIGPTQYPLPVREAFTDLLSEAGVDDPASRIFVSDLPLR